MAQKLSQSIGALEVDVSLGNIKLMKSECNDRIWRLWSGSKLLLSIGALKVALSLETINTNPFVRKKIGGSEVAHKLL